MEKGKAPQTQGNTLSASVSSRPTHSRLGTSSRLDPADDTTKSDESRRENRQESCHNPLKKPSGVQYKILGEEYKKYKTLLHDQTKYNDPRRICEKDVHDIMYKRLSGSSKNDEIHFNRWIGNYFKAKQVP